MFQALPCSSSGGLPHNCICAASGIVTLCRWLSCAPVKNQCTRQDSHVQIFLRMNTWMFKTCRRLTYLLTPCSRVLLEKLTGFQLLKKFSAIYGTRRFITTVTSAHHLSLSWASSIQSVPPHPTSWRSILIQVPNLKVDRILIWVIYLLRFTTCYITQLTCIYTKCWKWCPFISMHLSTCFTMFLATFLSILLFTYSMARVIFIFKILNFSKKLSTVGVRHRF